MGFKGTLINKSVVQPAISASGSLATFGQSISQNLKKLLVNISPVQSGTGDPSPSNVRPITGWTGANVYRTGQNLFDESTIYHGYYLPSTPSSHTASEAYRTAIVTLPRGTYTFKCDLENIVVIRYAIGKTNHTLSTSVNPLTFDVNETSVVQVCFSNADTSTITETFHTQIEVGSSASAYSPYNGTVYPVSWSDSAGTVYGGTLDVVSGKLIVDRKDVLLSTLTWERRTVRTFSASLGTGNSARATVPVTSHLCDTFPTEYDTSYTQVSALHLGLYKTSSAVLSGTIYLKLTSAEISDSSAEFRQWLIDHPVHLCYVLYNPIEYDLTPTEVQTLLGVNNIWADVGDVEVETKEVLGRLRFSLVDKYVQVPPAPAAVTLGSLSSPLNSPSPLVSVSPDIAEKELTELQMEEGPEEEPAEDPIVEEGENDDIE